MEPPKLREGFQSPKGFLKGGFRGTHPFLPPLKVRPIPLGNLKPPKTLSSLRFETH